MRQTKTHTRQCIHTPPRSAGVARPAPPPLPALGCSSYGTAPPERPTKVRGWAAAAPGDPDRRRSRQAPWWLAGPSLGLAPLRALAAWRLKHERSTQLAAPAWEGATGVMMIKGALLSRKLHASLGSSNRRPRMRTASCAHEYSDSKPQAVSIPHSLPRSGISRRCTHQHLSCCRRPRRVFLFFGAAAASIRRATTHPLPQQTTPKKHKVAHVSA